MLTEVEEKGQGAWEAFKPNLELNMLQDKLLTALFLHVPFSLFEVGQAYKRIKSFDKLLSCITKAKQEGRSLESIVDVMEGLNGR